MALIVGTSSLNTQILAAGTTGERPASPSAGQLRYNSTDVTFEVYVGGSWTTFGSTLGTIGNPAASAAAIKAANPSAADGLYYININGIARQIWCDMANGGWMLAAKMYTPSDSTWAYASSYWTDSSVLNATSTPSDAVNIKSYAWFAPLTQAKICMGSTTNFVTETHSAWTQSNGTGLNGVFSVARLDRTDNANTSRNSVITRANWITLFNGAGIGTYTNSGSGVSWDNCNYAGVNVGANNGNNYCRYGIHINNEADCTSCDYHIGFGWAGSGGANNPGNVGVLTRDAYTGSSYRSQYPMGWIFVK